MKDNVVLITGSTGDIGRATAFALAGGSPLNFYCLARLKYSPLRVSTRIISQSAQVWLTTLLMASLKKRAPFQLASRTETRGFALMLGK